MTTYQTASEKEEARIEFEEGFAKELRSRLDRYPLASGWQVSRNPIPWHLLATANTADETGIELWVHCRHDEPQDLHDVNIEREFAPNIVRVGVLAMPVISYEMAKTCERHGWSWFDMEGNCHIQVPNVLEIRT